MADDVKPTRKELMRIEDRIELSERGHDTLEQKRDGLIMEFMDILDEAQDVRSDLDERGYGVLGTSARIDEAASAYEKLLDQIILAAEVETAMKKMLDEIETTKRRVNALEFKLLPDLRENQEYIEQKLEEQEREEIFRMKKIKDKKEREEAEEAAETEADEEEDAETVAADD